MDLWIRSQDGNKLFNVHELYIRERTQPKAINSEPKPSKFEILGNDEIIATYSSQERALEVLDDIQHYLLDGAFAKMENGLGEVKNIIPNPIFVYGMPKE